MTPSHSLNPVRRHYQLFSRIFTLVLSQALVRLSTPNHLVPVLLPGHVIRAAALDHTLPVLRGSTLVEERVADLVCNAFLMGVLWNTVS
jgi:hypothetical protein